MKKVIAIVLIAGGLIMGYAGVKKVQSSTASMEVLGLQVGAADQSGKRQGYLYLGIAAVLFIGGVYTLRRR